MENSKIMFFAGIYSTKFVNMVATHPGHDLTKVYPIHIP